MRKLKQTFFSAARLLSVMTKEFRQMRRDRLTFGMIVGIPLIQLILFGFAINSNPHRLPTAIASADHTPLTRTYITGLQNTQYFEVVNNNVTEDEGDRLLQSGDALFVLHVPANFTRDLYAGFQPNLLLSVDGTDPMASGNAVNAARTIVRTILNDDLQHSAPALQSKPDAFGVIVHTKYNPEAITQYNIVPGLLGVVLTMTMVMITALAITRERERGTMESLLATPVQPLEVMLGKIIPYIVVGFIQACIICFFSVWLFGVPFVGSLSFFMLAIFVFIAANLSLGLVFSTIAQNQLQAMQLTFFFFLPSILLSGFMFPFKGMPHWAQVLGSCLPLTHFLRIVRGIMLKDISALMVWSDVWPIFIFMGVVLLVGWKRFSRTLD